MPSTLLAPSVPQNLESAIENLDPAILDPARRRELLGHAFELRSGRERPGPFWKIDLDSLDFSSYAVATPSRARIAAPAASRIIACDLSEAIEKHRDLVTQALGTAVGSLHYKFAALAGALCNIGAFIYIPADCAVDDPIEVVYSADAAALFPYTLVLAEHGSRCTIVERAEGGSGTMVCGITEIISRENSIVAYAAEQDLAPDARAIFTRVAAPGESASIAWSFAEMGAVLAVSSVDVIVDRPGAQVQLNGFFFPRGDQHVDLVSTVRHNVGESSSETIIKSAAHERGQARYLGNIRIAPHAQGTQASLRDDALLLSRKAHIDSIPALEIGANDVKAYHGATIGALDEDVIFYMESRGINRDAAEKMITLGFFDPVIERFPSAALRDRLRAGVEAKIS